MNTFEANNYSDDLDQVETRLLDVLDDACKLVNVVKNAMEDASGATATAITTMQDGKQGVESILSKLESAHDLLVKHAVLIQTYEPSQLPFNTARLRAWDERAQTKHALDILRRTKTRLDTGQAHEEEEEERISASTSEKRVKLDDKQ